MKLSPGWIGILGGLWLLVLTSVLAFSLRVGDDHIVIAAGPRNGDSFELARAIAEVAEERFPRLRIEVFETQGSAENVRLLQSGHADLACIQSDVESDGSVHAVASLYFDAYQLIVAADSPVQQPADLAGRTVAIGSRGSGHFESFWLMVEHYGLDTEDVVALPMSSEAAIFAMRHGQIDAMFRVHALANESMRDFFREFPARLIPIDQATAMSIRHPAVSSGSIPRGAYRGSPPVPGRDSPTAMVERVLVARAGLEEGVVRDLTRVLFEERSGLIARNPLAGFITAPEVEGKLALAIHDGARRYYDREKPSFWQENTRILSSALYVIVIASSAIFAIRTRLGRRRQVRMSRLNLDLMDIAEEAAATSKESELHGLHERLVAMLRGVVTDLDRDRVSQGEFEHFSFTWDAVDTLVRDRMTRVAKEPRDG